MARRPAPAAAPPENAPIDWDAIEGVAAPRETPGTIGQDVARGAFAEAWASGRRHHAWLLRGPRGVGKASFAYEAARLALTEDADQREAERALSLIRAGAHPGLFELRRGVNEKTGKPRASIAIDDVRSMIGFFQLTAPDRGWRVALIDPADDLNTAAANALLKLLEEPPKRALFLLTAHAAGRLPATIRSRCRRLDFQPLPLDKSVEAMRAAAPDLPEDEAETLARLSEGSPGEALRLRAAGGVALYRDILAFLAAPADPQAQRPLTEAAGRRDAASPGIEVLARLLPLALARIARSPYRPEGLLEAEISAARKLCGGDGAARIWAEAASGARDRLEAAAGLHLDPGRAILDTALYLDEAARRARAA